MRPRSPSRAPPLKGDDGSTASTPMRRPAARKARTSADVTVDFPTPGEPVSPTTRALPVKGAMPFITRRSSGASFSTSDTSRPRERASPALAAVISASGSALPRGGRPRAPDAVSRSATGRRGHPQQQGVTLAAAAAEGRGAYPAAPAGQFVDKVQRDPGPADAAG